MMTEQEKREAFEKWVGDSFPKGSTVTWAKSGNPRWYTSSNVANGWLSAEWDGFQAALALSDERVDELEAALRTVKGDILCMADWCGGMEDDRVMSVMHRLDAVLPDKEADRG